MGVLADVRQEKFCQLVVKGTAALEAYEQAGWRRDVGTGGNSSRMLHKPHIQARIQELMTNAAHRVEITASRVLEEMAKLAFHNPADYLTFHEDGSATVDLSTITRDHAAAITEVTSETDDKGRVKTKVKLADKKGALVELGRHLGLWVDRHEHGAPGDFASMNTTEEVVAQIRKELGDRDAELFLSMLKTTPDKDESVN